MIVVSDTTPISSLLKINRIEILHSLFSTIIIPTAVHNELIEGFSDAPALNDFLAYPWVKIITPQQKKSVAEFLKLLDAGESEAIVLAMEISADHLLIDETEGRRIAIQHGLNIIGTAGILLLAKKRKLITELKPILNQLITTSGFWLDKKILAQILKDAGE